jgi:hypothetical protein
MKENDIVNYSFQSAVEKIFYGVPSASSMPFDQTEFDDAALNLAKQYEAEDMLLILEALKSDAVTLIAPVGESAATRAVRGNRYFDSKIGAR